MNSKKHLFDEAERLFVSDFCTIDEISAKLKLNRKTVTSWRDNGLWEKKRKDYLKSKQCFHEELYELARKLMRDISIDLDNGEKVDSGRMYAFCKIIPMFVKVKDYEDIMSKKNKEEAPKGLSPEIIRKIEEEVLGITRNEE